MRPAFLTDILRSIKGSLGRFLAIMGITALGCGFYAGLQMCGPDMRADADRLYDGTNLWDVRLISTLGFGEDDVSRVRAVEGVLEAMPSLTCDAMARLGSEQVAVRISTLEPSWAETSVAEGDYVVASDAEGYLNRPRLVSGRWPRELGECVISADAPEGFCDVGDMVELLYGSTDLDELLATRTYKVVGTASSSNYPYTGSFGSTTLGSGIIDDYLYVAPASLAEDAPYTEIYLIVKGAAAELSESEAYREVVAATKERLEGLEAELSAARQDDLRRLAQDKLDEKWDEYEREKAKAECELADALAELEDAAAQIADGERQLAEGEAAYRAGLAEYASQRESVYAQLDAAAEEIKQNQAALDAAPAQLDEAEAGLVQLEAGEAAWAETRAELAQASADIATCRSALSSVAALVQTDIPTTEEGLDAYRAQVEACLGQVESAIGAARSLYGMLADSDLVDFDSDEVAAQLETLLAGVREDFSGIDWDIEVDEDTSLEDLIEQLREISAEVRAAAASSLGRVESLAQEGQAQVDGGIASGDAQLADALSQLTSGIAGAGFTGHSTVEVRSWIAEQRAALPGNQRNLDEARATLASKRRTARAELEKAKAQLDVAAAQLDDSRVQLADARRQYAEGRAAYEDARAEADEKFAEALAQLEDAQRQIDEIERPDIYALDRTQSEGAATYHADAGRMDNIAAVFPFMFFLVAALVSLTTMTRMVEDDRVQIGTYKALGYSTAAIASKYLAYAATAGLVGAVVGILVLSQVLPFIVMSAYSIIYVVPIHAFPLPIDVGIALAAGGLGVGVTLAATWGAVVSSLREVPATLMLPRAPAAGKRIMLERAAVLWDRLTFTWKVTFRNLFRYKRRFLMTVVGISGCTALLLVGFGLHDSIWDIIDRQYGPIIHYDTTVGLDDTAIELDVRRVCDYLEGTGEVSGIVRVQNENMQAGAEGSSETIRVNVVVPRSAEQITGATTFQGRLSGEPLEFGDDAVLVTEKLAMKYGLGVGSTILLFDQDDVGNAVGEGHALTVTGVAENYVGNLVYVGRGAWARVSDAVPVYSTIYASTTADDAVRQTITDELHELEGVSTVIFSDETINTYRNMLSVVDMIVVVLIVSAAALAYIVLYNLTNINIGERIREIASLKVLGFTRGEVYAYIFREIALLAVIGDALGMVLGIYLERFVVTTAEVDYVMFGRDIHPTSFAYSFALTLVFTALVILTMRRKLDRVNMVESLKSVD